MSTTLRSSPAQPRKSVSLLEIWNDQISTRDWHDLASEDKTFLTWITEAKPDPSEDEDHWTVVFLRSTDQSYTCTPLVDLVEAFVGKDTIDSLIQRSDLPKIALVYDLCTTSDGQQQPRYSGQLDAFALHEWLSRPVRDSTATRHVLRHPDHADG
jgi:hypothetical protein